MTSWRIRDFHSADLGGILHLWEALKASNVEPVYALSEVLASCEKDHAVVAVQGEQVVGAAVGRAAHDQGWIVFLAPCPNTEDGALAPRCWPPSKTAWPRTGSTSSRR